MLARIIGLVGLLLCEGMFLGIRYDADSVTRLPQGWWTGLLAVAGRVMPLAAVVGAATVLVAGSSQRQRLFARQSARRHPRQLLLLVAHLIAFAGLFGLSEVLFGGGDAAMRHTWLWVTGWLLAAGLTGLLWLAVLFPNFFRHALIRESGGLITAGLAVGIIAWISGQYTERLWTLLRGSTFRSALILLRLLDRSAWADPRQFLIGASGFTVEISPDCSGYEGIGLVLVFLVAFFWIFRRQLRFPRVLLLLPMAIVAVWVANSLRIAALVEIGSHFSPDIAAGGFHSYAGVLLFLAVALTTASVAYHSPSFSKSATSVDSEELGQNPAAPLLLPLLAMVAVGLVTGLVWAGGPDRLYPVRFLAAVAVLWYYRREYRRTDLFAAASPALAAGVGVVVFLIWIVFWRPPATGAPQVAGSSAILLFWRIAGMVLVSPVAEELAFRPYLIRRLTRAGFEAVHLQQVSAFAIIASAGLFALLSGHLIAGFLAGLAFGLLARRTGRVADAIVAHASCNIAFAGYAVMTHSWWLWS
jgi:exosortase E/protease (VPEID-CTERM system)